MCICAKHPTFMESFAEVDRGSVALDSSQMENLKVVEIKGEIQSDESYAGHCWLNLTRSWPRCGRCRKAEATAKQSRHDMARAILKTPVNLRTDETCTTLRQHIMSSLGRTNRVNRAVPGVGYGMVTSPEVYKALLAPYGHSHVLSICHTLASLSKDVCTSLTGVYDSGRNIAMALSNSLSGSIAIRVFQSAVSPYTFYRQQLEALRVAFLSAHRGVKMRRREGGGGEEILKIMRSGQTEKSGNGLEREPNRGTVPLGA